MPAHRIVPSDSILEKWVDQGMSIEDMRQRIYEDSGRLPGKSTISAALSRAGLTSRVRYTDMIPWERIKVEHNSHYILHQLRVGARLARDLPVRDGERRRYEHWLEELATAGAVVHYDPETEEGFMYVARTAGDEGIVRMPKR